MRGLWKLIVFLMLLCLVVWPAGAQSVADSGDGAPHEEPSKETAAPEPEHAEPEAVDWGNSVRLRPEEIPEFNVVTMFFYQAQHRMDSASPHQRDHFLRSIGVEPGTVAADFVDEIIEAAADVLRIRTIDTSLEGEEFEQAQYEAIRDKARQLGIVYRNLILGLDDAGISPQAVLDYCAKMRNNLAVSSTEADNSQYFEAASTFDQALEVIDLTQWSGGEN